MSHAVQTSMGRYFEPDQRVRQLALPGSASPSAKACSRSAWRSIGWRETWLVGAVAAIFFVTPAILWLLKVMGSEAAYQAKIDARAPTRPRDGAGLDIRGDRDPRFFIASIMLMALAFVSTGVMFHQVHLSEIEAGPTRRSPRHSASTLMQIAFSIFIGWLNDRMGATTLVRWTMPWRWDASS